jgi:hypothetical protein
MNIRALKKLADFANTGEDHKDWRVFIRQAPNFFPNEFAQSVELWNEKGQFKNHYVHSYRHMLRKVWRGQDEDGVRLAWLLGIYSPYDWVGDEDLVLDTDARAFCQMLEDSGVIHIDELPMFRFLKRPVKLNWGRGLIEYSPPDDCQFQSSVHELFRESWRAHVCPQCGSYFVASKPAQRLCSTDCRDAALRQAQNKYWKEKGAARRKARTKNLKRHKGTRR